MSAGKVFSFSVKRPSEEGFKGGLVSGQSSRGMLREGMRPQVKGCEGL